MNISFIFISVILGILIFAAIFCSVFVVVSAALFLSGFYSRRVAKLKVTYSFSPLGEFKHNTISVGCQDPERIDVRRLPGYFVALLLLHEDDRFFVHNGFNLPEVANRVTAVIFGRDSLKGGSSITQQLAKNVVLHDRYFGGLSRFLQKMREAGATIALEQKFTKHELLSLYLMTPRLNHQSVYGFHNAAKWWFRKSIYELSFSESLFLIGLLPNPQRIIQLIGIKKAYWRFPRDVSFTKSVDIFRLYMRTWGIDVLEDLSLVGSDDVYARFLSIGSYSPNGLASVSELTLELRAFEELSRLDSLIMSFSNEQLKRQQKNGKADFDIPADSFSTGE